MVGFKLRLGICLIFNIWGGNAHVYWVHASYQLNDTAIAVKQIGEAWVRGYSAESYNFKLVVQCLCYCRLSFNMELSVRYLFGILGTNRDQPFNSVRESQDTFNDTQRSISPVRFSREGPLIRSLDDREQSFSSNLDDRDQLLVTMSSAGGESLEEVWRMLDRPTPSPFTTPRYSGKTGTNLLLSLIVNFS